MAWPVVGCRFQREPTPEGQRADCGFPMESECLLQQVSVRALDTSVTEREVRTRPHNLPRRVDRPEHYLGSHRRGCRRRTYLAPIHQRFADRESARDRWPQMPVGLCPDFAEVDHTTPTVGKPTFPDLLYVGPQLQHLNVKDTVIGDAVNVAQRLQTEAGAGEVLVAAATIRAAGHPEAEWVGSRQLKGRQEPVEVFRISWLQPERTDPARLLMSGEEPTPDP